jgi:predicted nucleic acid-binding protein
MRKPRPAASAIYLDANVFIYLVDGDQATSAAVLPLFEALRNKPGVGVTSEISLAEVLAGRDARTRRLYMDLMVFGQFLTLVPVDRDVLYDTADLRKVAKMKLVDAIHMATAIRTRCRYFVTRDGDFRRMPRGMTKILPDATAIADLVTKVSS